MPKTKISEFSSTPANNTDIDSINIAEGCSPSGINDAIRELMSQLKDWQSGTSNDPMVIGSSGSLTLNQGTANGVTYLNGSKVVTSGSALTFSGSALGVNATSTDASMSIQALTANYASVLSLVANNDNGAQYNNISSSTSGGTVHWRIGGNAGVSQLPFSIAGTEQMRLTSTGLGIGTSSPSAKLDVRGNFVVSDGTNGNVKAYVDSNKGYIQSLNQAQNAYRPLNLMGSTVGFENGSGNTLTLDASGNLLVGTTNGIGKLAISTASGTGSASTWDNTFVTIAPGGTSTSTGLAFSVNTSTNTAQITSLTPGVSWRDLKYKASQHIWEAGASQAEAARIDSSGNLLVGGTTIDVTQNIMFWNRGSGTSGHLALGNTEGSNSTSVIYVNRQNSDGTLMEFRQANTTEGSISVSGTTVSYNGGHLSRWAQTTAPKDNTLVKGTVLSNLDEMSVYTKDGQPVANEQLNKVKISDTEGDANVAGVFVNWSHDEVHNVDEINMAMTGDMIIRIAQGTTVVRGDLLMSAGNGTAKPQGDDIVRSKTIAKVTSNHVTCTYADGSYCVPCVLMAC